MANPQYPFDPDGLNPANAITQEQHVLVPPDKVTDASVIVPRAAPFFTTGANPIKVYAGTLSSNVELVLGVDYQFVYKHIRLSYLLGRPVYGGIKFIDRTLNTNIILDYQTIGSNFVVNDAGVIEALSRSVRNVDYFNWERAAGLPSDWGTIDHPALGPTSVGYDQMVDAVKDVAASINSLNTPGAVDNAALQAHLTANSAHTPSQVGLGNLQNFPIALQGDYPAGRVDAYANPLGVRQYVISVLPTAQLAALEQEVDDLQGTTQQLVADLDSLSLTVDTLADAIDQAEIDIDALIQHRLVIDAAILTLQNEQAAQALSLQTVYSQINTANTNISLALSQIAGMNAIGAFTSGTHRLSLRPNRKASFVVITAGGNGGLVVADALDYIGMRPTGGIKITRHTNDTNGQPLSIPVTVAFASHGGHGGYTLEPTRYGLGGLSGQGTIITAEVDAGFTVTNGVDGVDGTSGDTAPTTGATGHEHATQPFGYGQDGEAKAGSGGSGAMLVFEISNTENFDIQYVIDIQNLVSTVDYPDDQRPIVFIADSAV